MPVRVQVEGRSLPTGKYQCKKQHTLEDVSPLVGHTWRQRMEKGWGKVECSIESSDEVGVGRLGLGGGGIGNTTCTNYFLFPFLDPVHQCGSMPACRWYRSKLTHWSLCKLGLSLVQGDKCPLTLSVHLYTSTLHGICKSGNRL